MSAVFGFVYLALVFRNSVKGRTEVLERVQDCRVGWGPKGN